MAERSFAKEVQSLRLGAGAEFRGEGILAVTKALLQSGVAYVGGDPMGALVHAREALKSDGKVMLVEPYAGDSVEDNLNPIGRLFYAASAMACTPNSLSQEVGLALGAQAGPERLRSLARQAGFRELRLATQTPVNLVLEVVR